MPKVNVRPALGRSAEQVVDAVGLSRLVAEPISPDAVNDWARRGLIPRVRTSGRQRARWAYPLPAALSALRRVLQQRGAA